MKRAVAVPTCSSTTKARNEGSRWSIDQWNRRGRMTVCPRLLTGKSSVTPCRRASTRAWKNDTSQYHDLYATRLRRRIRYPSRHSGGGEQLQQYVTHPDFSARVE